MANTICTLRFSSRRALFAAPVLLALSACGGGGSGGGGQVDANTSTNQTPMQQSSLSEVRKRVVVKFSIAGLEGEDETRNVNHMLLDSGWDSSGYVQAAVQLLKNHGLHRADLHNPFGRLDGEAFQFDQYLEAKDVPALDKVTKTFIPAWNKYLSPLTGNGNIEVIGYVGSPRNDPESADVAGKEGLDAFYRRGHRSVAPFLKTGMSIGLDNSTPGHKSGFTYKFAQRMREMGRKVYVEATPRSDYDWWFDYPVIIREKLWDKRLGDPRYATRAGLTNELIRYPKIDRSWAKTHPDTAWPPVMCKVIAQGDTLMVGGYLLRYPYQDRSIQGLVDCANKMAAAQNG